MMFKGQEYGFMLYDSRELPLAYFDNYLQLSSYTGRSRDELQASVCKGAGLILGGKRYILKKVLLDVNNEEGIYATTKVLHRQA